MAEPTSPAPEPTATPAAGPAAVGANQSADTFSLDQSPGAARTALQSRVAAEQPLEEGATIETKASSTLQDVAARQDKAKDDTRQTITLWLIGLFVVIVVLSFVALFMVGLQGPGGFDGEFFQRLKTLLDVLLGPVITLLSSAIGFYFGYQQATAARAGSNPSPGAQGGGGNRS